jgi:hypothetical protein
MSERFDIGARRAFFPPPPCGEGSGAGVAGFRTGEPYSATPHPDAPPQGGRET